MIEKLFKIGYTDREVCDKINEIIDWINVHRMTCLCLNQSPESTGKSEVDLSVSQDTRKGCGKRYFDEEIGFVAVCNKYGLCEDCKVKGASKRQ